VKGKGLPKGFFEIHFQPPPHKANWFKKKTFIKTVCIHASKKPPGTSCPATMGGNQGGFFDVFPGLKKKKRDFGRRLFGGGF